MSHIETAELLEMAADTNATVTLTMASDNRIRTGTVRPHPTDPALFTIKSFGAERKVEIHPDDVAEVTFE